MDDQDFGDRPWPTRVVPWSICFAIIAVAVWWFLNRERPVTAQLRLAVLRDPTARDFTRRLAAENLGHSDAAVVPELVQELREGDNLGRELAALVLERFIARGCIATLPDHAVMALRDGAHDRADSVREWAFAALRRLGEVGVRELLTLLADGDADVRRRAALGLGQMGCDTDEVVEGLHAALADSDPRVRAESYVESFVAWHCRTRPLYAGRSRSPGASHGGSTSGKAA